ncbi:MAG: ABC transporter ATP-binding protein [Burkholderiaceae bacterium]
MAAATPALQLHDVHKRFGYTEILRGIDLRVERGERHAIIGPNGAGKSTLFDLISGRLPLSSGRIELNGRDIGGRRPFEVNRLGLARSFQITNLFGRLSAFENLRCATLFPLGYRYSFWHRLARRRDAAERADAVLAEIGLRHRRDVPAAVLTYAEQRALEIGVTIAGGADVILLDEPTAGMSRSESDAAMALIRRVSEGRTLLMVEHDMSVVFGVAQRITVLVQGRIVASDTPERVRADPAVREAYLGSAFAEAASPAGAAAGSADARADSRNTRSGPAGAGAAGSAVDRPAP